MFFLFPSEFFFLSFSFPLSSERERGKGASEGARRGGGQKTRKGSKVGGEKTDPSLPPHTHTLSHPSPRPPPPPTQPQPNLQQDKGYTFGNVLVTDSAEEAAAIRKETWEAKKDAEKAAAEKEAAEAREKAKKLAAEAEAKAKKEAKAKEQEDATTLAERISSLFDEGAPLEAFADAAEPLLDALDEREWLAWAIVAVPAAILLAPLVLLARRGSKSGEKKGAKKGAASSTIKASAAAAKKDVSAADDKVAAEADAAPAGDDDSDEKAGATRRRAPRHD